MQSFQVNVSCPVCRETVEMTFLLERHLEMRDGRRPTLYANAGAALVEHVCDPHVIARHMREWA